MPRTRRPAQGRPGEKYPNRTDLGSAEKQAVRVPKGMPYGQGKKIAELQNAVPLPEPQTVPNAVPAGAEPFDRALQAAQAMPFPNLGLARPTERPSEPLTAGLPVGAGPGPEVLGRSTGQHVSSTLQRLADATSDSELSRLANIARAQGM